MKYELTDEIKTAEYGAVLHRIRALMDIPRLAVSKGDLGGWVEDKYNLSQAGDAWVDGDAWVGGNAQVCGNAVVGGNAVVRGNAVVCGDASVGGNASVGENAWVGGSASVFGNAVVGGNAWVGGNANVFGKAVVGGSAAVSESANVFDKAVVGGRAAVNGRASICGDAKVSSVEDYTVFKNCWSSGRWFTYTRSNKKWSIGCFYGTGDELIKKAYADSDRSGRCYEAIVKAVETIKSATAKEGDAK